MEMEKLFKRTDKFSVSVLIYSEENVEKIQYISLVSIKNCDHIIYNSMNRTIWRDGQSFLDLPPWIMINSNYDD